MTSPPPSYRGYRFPPEIIAHAVWVCHRFGLSFRNVEDLLAERGIIVTYETIRQWCLTFGTDYARRLRSRRGRQGDTWYLDGVAEKMTPQKIADAQQRATDWLAAFERRDWRSRRVSLTAPERPSSRCLTTPSTPAPCR